MAKMLDRNRDFGEVMGSGIARFEQDGALFDIYGRRLKAAAITAMSTFEEVIDESDDESPIPPVVEPEMVVDDTAADTSELDAQLAAQGVL